MVQFSTLAELAGPAGKQCLLGLGGDEAAPVYCDLLAAHSRFLIAGPARSGRSTATVLIAQQARQAGLAVLVAASRRSPLFEWANAGCCPTLEPGHQAPPEAVGIDLVVVDDCEQFTDTAAGDYLLELVLRHPAAVVVSARADDLMVSFRGIGVEMRRHRNGLLLQPSPVDGELLGIRLGPHRPVQPIGRGLLITDHTRQFASDGLPVQLAR
jgi:S-DNA-T family DNA segregation ATPase FtsK/SpoIIIE